MNNKEKFLTELREYLSVLENQEQDDICAEYAQHIDMKMQKGLSEEEAIRDFGSVEQLAAEILEAYHVNPEFRRQGFSFRMSKFGTGALRSSMQAKATRGFELLRHQDNNEQKAASRWRRAGAWIKKATAKAAHGIGNAFRWIGGTCRAFMKRIVKPFARKSRENDGEIQEAMMGKEGAERAAGDVRRAGGMIGRGMAALWSWFTGVCLFWMKFMWNAAWLLFALFCACMAMIVLLGVGAIPILLSQGYPFKGIFIICIGGLLCFGALAYGALGLLIRKQKNNGSMGCSRHKEDQEVEKCDKEAGYEQTT